MQEVKFTKAPWTEKLNDDGSFCVTGCGGHIGHPYYVVCSRQKHEISSETHANAHLISAAPELYEALECLLKADHDDVRAMARAALSKARGEQC